MELLIPLLVMVALGMWAQGVMKPKGYGSVSSFFIGFLGGIFGVILAYVLPVRKEDV